MYDLAVRFYRKEPILRAARLLESCAETVHDAVTRKQRIVPGVLYRALVRRFSDDLLNSHFSRLVPHRSLKKSAHVKTI
jgi:hypothetical protein